MRRMAALYRLEKKLTSDSWRPLGYVRDSGSFGVDGCAQCGVQCARDSPPVQSGASRDGIAGVYGNDGIVECVTYRI
jgi:hypothetical protein